MLRYFVCPLQLCLAISLCTGTVQGQNLAKRLPAPNAEQLADASGRVGAVYRDDFDKASSPPLKLALVNRMLKDAALTNDDPVARYAMLLAAQNIAAKAGDWDASMKVIAALSQSYEVDVFSLADKARVDIDRANVPTRDPRATYALLMDIIAEAVANPHAHQPRAA